MITSNSATFRIVLYEGQNSLRLNDAVRAEVLRSLLERGYKTSVCRDGMFVSPVHSDVLLILGRFSAPEVPALLPDDPRVQLFLRDVGELSAAGVLELVDAVRGEAELPKPGGWKPWFPVIDFDRCTNCMQCLSFCLFDVYGVSAGGKIQVQHESNCKTDCPACSRVCPEVAILFPKYRHGPINGDQVSADDVRREAMKVDISALLGGDIYAALRDRSAKAKSRFSTERDEERALKERQRCLDKLQQSLDIPAEVLASLPAVADIQSRAKQAQARAAAALREPNRSTPIPAQNGQ